MKHLLSVLALVATLASPASADPVALDYRAEDPSCIAASRFADEVSAKLGFVPWDDTAKAKIRVRVEREGDQFTGSVRNVDGTSKIIDGATCASVTSKLAVTVAGAIDRTDTIRVVGGVAPAPARTAPPPADGKIPVTFASADGRRIDISLNVGGGTGVSSTGATMVANYYEGLCTTPCTARLPQGRHYLLFQDPDSSSVGGDRFLIDQPTQITLHHKSRKGTRRALFATGAVLAGASIAGGIMLGGAGGAVVGGLGGGFALGFMISPLLVHDTFTATRAP